MGAKMTLFDWVIILGLFGSAVIMEESLTWADVPLRNYCIVTFIVTIELIIGCKNNII